MVPAALPLSWREALLAVLPGLLAVAAAVSPGMPAWSLVGPALLAAYLFAATWWSGRRVPAWSLMAAGMLASIALSTAAGVLGGLAAVLTGDSALLVVLLLVLVALAALLAHAARVGRVTPRAWGLLGLIVACQLAVRAKYFSLYGVSWSIAGQWLVISLYAAASGLLLPIALGLLLARRYGAAAELFVVGMVYGGLQLLIDVQGKVSEQIGSGPLLAAYRALVPLLITLVAPLWFLRAPSARRRIAGLLAVTGLAVVADLVVVGLSYRGDLQPVVWISFVPYTASVLIALALAHLLHRHVPHPGEPEKHTLT